MADDASPMNRKRAPNDDGEQDASVPQTKRLKGDEAPIQTEPRSGLQVLGSVLNGVFGYNRQPQQVNGTTTPSLAPAASTAPKADIDPLSKPSPPSKPAAAPMFSPSPAKSRPAIKMSALRGTKWDDGKGPAPKSPTPKKGTPGRKPAAAVADLQRTPSKGTPGRKKGSPLKKSTAAGDPYDVDELAVSGADLTPNSKATGGKRLFGSGAATPKNILTPTKRRGRPPKNAKIGSRLDDEVFFEDAPKSVKGKKTSHSLAVQAPGPEDIACAICSKGHSKAPNEILLCDICDYAVHQECYGIPEIPEGDWLCKSCAQEDILKTLAKTEEAVKVTQSVVPDIPNLDQHVRSLQRVLLDRCTGFRPIRLTGQQEAHEKARQLVEQTVLAGEGNSMLLIGPRGSGKTTLVETIVSDLSKEHKHDFHVIRLNGFIHTDDKLALKEIWRQLGKEMEVEDDLININNYADTMTSLLALLSHPSEIMGTEEGITSQSVVFIIDEFDMFAAHPRQTLLYNLFDVAQSRKAPIAVLGCTTRLDVVEMLEKRVKSRFSHRYVYLNLPRSLPGYWAVCKQGLMVNQEDAAAEGMDTELEGHGEFQQHWNHKIEALYKERAFQDLLQYHYYTSKSASAFCAEWIMPLSQLSGTDLDLPIPSATTNDASSLLPPDSRIHLLTTLSELDLSLLIAAARLDIIAHTDTVNFAMAYDEYSSLVGRQRVQSQTSGMHAIGGAAARVWSRGVAGIAWERLINLGLLVPAGIGGGRSLGHGGLEGKMWKVDVALEEIPTGVKLSNVLAKWCREI